MATGERDDPYAGFNFTVEIDGVTIAGFNEVSGLTSETDGNRVPHRRSREHRDPSCRG